MKLSVVAISCFIVACYAAESQMINDVSYKNHRTSSKNDTQNKYPVYSAQVYANLSNIKDFTAVETEQPKLTETPLDAVRIYITPTTIKKRQDVQQTVIQTTQLPSIVSSMSRTSPHPMFYVTATNSADHDQRGPVYSVSSTSNVKETTDFRTSAVSESSHKSGRSDGTKIKKASKIQNQSQYLLYATTQSPLPPPPTFAVAASKTQLISSNVSKPFATVLVPKQMLDGGESVSYNVREDSFRPIAAPLYSYKPNVIDSNSVPENRRASTYNVVGSTMQSASIPAKLVKSGFAKSDTYKVQEEHAHAMFKERLADHSFNVPNDKHLRDKPSQPYAEKLQTTENPKRDQMKLQKDVLQHHGFSEKNVQRYAGYAASDPSKYDKVQPYKSALPKSADQFREFYPATEVPTKDVMSYLPYNSAGKYDVRYPLPLEREKLQGSPPNKVLLSGQPTWSTPVNSGPASGGPEFVMDDVNAKDMLKSILQDMLKSKQQAEVKQPLKSVGTDEIIDSYFKINPVDLSYDSPTIESGKTVIDIFILVHHKNS